MPLHEQTTDNWDRVRGVNLRGVYFCMRYGILSMRETGGGSVVDNAVCPGTIWTGLVPMAEQSPEPPPGGHSVGFSGMGAEKTGEPTA